MGHIFQLGQKYAQALNATVLDENGKAAVMDMGCYGIGVSRIVAAAIEQNHDDKGIIWPESIAPYSIALVALKYEKSAEVQKQADILYETLTQAGYEVILDDRAKVSPGAKMADMELMGIPHRIVISDRGIKAGTLEYKGRRDAEKQEVAIDEIINLIKEKVKR